MSVELASTKSSIANLSKTIIGAGMLAMPYAYRADGIILGSLIIVIAGITAGFGLYLQLRSARFLPEGQATFFGVCSISYPHLSSLFDFSVFLQCFGSAVSYLVIIGDLLPDLVNNDQFNRTAAILLSTIIIVPLCYLKNLDSLKYTSIVGLVAIAYLFLLVVLHFISGDTPSELRGPVRILKPLSLSSVFSTFSIIVFAFTGHQNMYSIINESKDKSTKNILKVIGSALGAATFLFVFIGLAGYFTFGDNVQGNVVLMFKDSIPNIVGRYAIILMVILSFPLMFHPCRLSAKNIFFWLSNLHKESKQEEDELTLLLATPLQDHAPVLVPFSNTSHVAFTTGLLLALYGLALSVSEFALVLSLVGATGSTSISFILPGLFGYKLLANDPTVNLYKSDLVVKYLSLALTVWGVFVMVLCIGATLLYT